MLISNRNESIANLTRVLATLYPSFRQDHDLRYLNRGQDLPPFFIISGKL